MKRTRLHAALPKAIVLGCGLVLTATDGIAAELDDMGTTYFSVEYVYLNPNVTGGDDYDNAAVMGKVGKVIAKNLAVEGFFALGIQSEEWTSENGCDSEEVSTDSIIGAQLRGFAELSPTVNIQGMIGYNNVAVSRTISGSAACYGYAWSETYDEDDGAVTIGFGAEFKMDKTSAIVANYQMFYDDDDVEISGYSIGYKHSF